MSRIQPQPITLGQRAARGVLAVMLGVAATSSALHGDAVGCGLAFLLALGLYEAPHAGMWKMAGLAAGIMAVSGFGDHPSIAGLLSHMFGLLAAHARRAAALVVAARVAASAESRARRLSRRTVEAARARLRVGHMCLLQRNLNHGKGHAATMAALALS